MLMKIYAETHAFAPDQGLFPKVHIKKVKKTKEKEKLSVFRHINLQANAESCRFVTKTI